MKGRIDRFLSFHRLLYIRSHISNSIHRQARNLVQDSAGVERTRVLAKAYADKAKEVLLHLPESEARQALEALADKVIMRKA